MLFEKEKYYKLINDLEKGVTVIYVIIMIICVLGGIAGGGVALIITIPLGLIISYFMTFATKIKIQEMKWRFDIYEKIIKGGI